MRFPWSRRSRFERAADALWPRVRAMSTLSARLKELSDSQLKAVVTRHRGKTRQALEPHVHEVFAAVREAADRTIGLRPFEVQLLGGLVLLDGNIAEMKTGEGKTLVATLPLTVHALTGQGAHLVTVNDYLSQRDADWMGPVYRFFDLSVGVIHPDQSAAEKRAAYAADITYGTNNEFGFDYLRDNMAPEVTALVQRGLAYAIVDEVDSILIDEARTPLIISSPDEESTSLYEQFSRLVPRLKEDEHYNVDEKRRVATLTEDGITLVEGQLGLDNIYQAGGMRMVHHLEQALRAHTLYHRDKDYVLKDGQVIIVDEFTGRLMAGRRYSEGLHQAIEAKEGVKVQQESRTLATITFQNFFRLYGTLAGMTGTATTSAEEFEKVYNLEVIAVPTHKPMIRVDQPDRIYMTEADKFTAAVEEIKQRYGQGQPVLVGTIAIEKSERLSGRLRQAGIPHEVLNAKHHAREAEIIALAGQPGAVTISTNMAGRGTDIKLGPGVADRGGLFVLGTERHEARRIDNQLRGRSGRQGDRGETRFFVSLQDDVMRIFGGDRIKRLMDRLKLPPDQPIEHRLVSRAIASAQERVEGYYFDMRKHVLAYDDVLNRQRNAIYTLRRAVLERGQWQDARSPAQPLADRIKEIVDEYARDIVTIHTQSSELAQWDTGEIAQTIHALTDEPAQSTGQRLNAAIRQTAPEGPDASREAVTTAVQDALQKRWQARQQELGADQLAALTRAAALRAIDTWWMEHLDTMDYLRTGIGLRGYGHQDPLVEYQKEGYQLFQRLIKNITYSLIEIVFKAQAVRAEVYQGQARHEAAARPTTTAEPALSASAAVAGRPATNPYRDVGRNDPCPCGSGKKFKKCHGK